MRVIMCVYVGVGAVQKMLCRRQYIDQGVKSFRRRTCARFNHRVISTDTHTHLNTSARNHRVTKMIMQVYLG
jgi:hypothetical protein